MIEALARRAPGDAAAGAGRTVAYRWMLWLVIVAMALPLALPAIPPLTDLPGHMASYAIEVDRGRSALLARYFLYHWAPVGNLGVDLLILPLGTLFGIEPATKLIVMAIPVLTAAGMLLTAREIHGRVPPTALFALPLAYGYPFQFGFVNFALSMALMFLGIGAWLRLGRLGHSRLRAALFVPFGFGLFMAHCVGWAMFGAALLAIETGAARRRGATPLRSFRGAIVACLPLAPSISLLIGWALYRSGGEAGHWSAGAKIYDMVAILRDARPLFDLLGASALLVLLACHRLLRLRFEPRLGLAALVLFLAFLATPQLLMGAWYADMRMAAYVVATALLALDASALRIRRRRIVAIVALLFLALRLVGHGLTYRDLDRSYRRELAVLDRIPPGARIFAMALPPCAAGWGSARLSHLSALAIERRHAFVNGQWPMPGGRLLEVRFPAAPDFAFDPTESIRTATCPMSGAYTIDEAMARLPRRAFGYVWLLGVPPAQWPHGGWLRPVWRSGDSVMFRIVATTS